MSKGEVTRERIVEHALHVASREGIEGITIGALANELRLSKSGLFAHFGSKEELQIAVLEAASARFIEEVLAPAFRLPRGRPRIRAIFDNWLRWINKPSMRGCLMVAAATELDDRDGRVREALANTQRQLVATLTKAARLAVEEGHFRSNLNCEQFAYEMLSIALGYHHFRRLLRDPKAEDRARDAFDVLLAHSWK